MAQWHSSTVDAKFPEVPSIWWTPSLDPVRELARSEPAGACSRSFLSLDGRRAAGQMVASATHPSARVPTPLTSCAFWAMIRLPGHDPGWTIVFPVTCGAANRFVRCRHGRPLGGVLAESNRSSSEAADYMPQRSPDSTYIAFVSTRDGNPEIYVVNEAGEKLRVTDDPADDSSPAWGPMEE